MEAVETAVMEEAPVEALEKFEQLVTPLITLATAKVKQASHAGLNTSSDALDVVNAHTHSECAPCGAQDGSLPLHIAVRIQGADAVVGALLECYPKGAETRDSVRYILHVKALEPACLTLQSPRLTACVVDLQLALRVCAISLTYPRALCLRPPMCRKVTCRYTSPQCSSIRVWSW